MKRLTGFLILHLFLLTRLSAQQYNFTTYTIEDGLSQSVVNCIFQDSKGYIWLGTQNGLDRFDGRNFELFRFNPADSNSISNNWIYAISEDTESNLWVGTKGGLQKYLRAENRFERIRYNTGYQFDVTNYNYDNIRLKNGNILVNTPPVISIYSATEKSFAHYINEFEYDATVEDVRIPTMEDRNGNIWVGSTKGLALFSPYRKEFTYCSFKNNSSGNRHTEEKITALFEDKFSRIWVGTSTGLFYSEKGNTHFEEVNFPLVTGENFRIQNCVRSMLEDKNSNLLIGTEGNGLYILSPEGDNKFRLWNRTEINSGIGHDIIQPMLIDKSDNLWVGTLRGISKTDLKQKKFRLYRNNNLPGSTNLLGNVIAGMFKNDDGIIWVGNWGQGLNLVNPETNEVEHFSTQHEGNHYLPNDFVHVIFKDAERNIWIGTRDGVFIYDKPQNRFVLWTKFFNRPNFPNFENTRIYHIIQDKLENIWIASSNGLYCFNIAESSQEIFHTDAEPGHRLGANLIYSILEDSEGLIWAATINGLDMYDPRTKQIQHFTKEIDGISSDFLISLAEDASGNIWIGSNAYINIFDKETGQFSYMGLEDGLPSNYIYEIRKDKNNNIWLATGYGLCMYNTKNKTLETFTQEDGLQSLEFNLRASFACPDGELLFGGMNGFNTFYPDSIYGNQFKPDLAFTSFSKVVDGETERVNLGKVHKVVLNHKVQSFTIEFAALEYTNPDNNYYAHKMEGISDKWMNVGNRTFAPFYALPAGNYAFWVKGSNNDGEWNNDAIKLNIVVLPPWWRSIYAYLAYSFLLLLLIIVYIKLRERRLQHDKRVLEQKVSERTRQIKQQNQLIESKNQELNELNRTKDKFFSIIGHDLGNHFNIIIGFTEVLLSGFRKMREPELEKHLTNINKSSLQAHDLLGNLLTWSRLQRNAILFNPVVFNVNNKIQKLIVFHEEAALNKNILINIISKEEIDIKADLNMFSTVFRNLVANALKFTYPDGEISISIKRESVFCEISVKDNGVGIPEENLEKIFRIDSNVTTKGTDGEKGTGLGLILCKEFVEKHSGEIRVNSQAGKGSEFVFTVPVAD